MVNWGMSEVGPMAINIIFENIDDVNKVKHDTLTLMGSNFWLDWKIEDNILFVKGDICAYDGWFDTQDIVKLSKENVMYYVGRKQDKIDCTRFFIEDTCLS